MNLRDSAMIKTICSTKLINGFGICTVILHLEIRRESVKGSAHENAGFY